MKDDTPELSRRPGEATPEFLVASGSTAQKIFVTRLFGAGIICGKTPCQGERCRMKLQRRLPDFAGVLSRAVFACCQRCAFGRRPRGDAHNRWPNSRCKKGIISSFSIQIICAQAGPQVSPPFGRPTTLLKSRRDSLDIRTSAPAAAVLRATKKSARAGRRKSTRCQGPSPCWSFFITASQLFLCPARVPVFWVGAH